ncbi:MAG: sulfurase [Pseudomonadota bacterium]
MSLLLPTAIEGEVVWLGRVTDRNETLASTASERLTLDFDGIRGEHHAGLTRRSCARVKRQYAVGTEIRNTRQVSIVSEQELKAVAEAMSIAELKPEWLGANIALKGIEQLTHIPPASRLIFDGGCSLVIDTENTPCRMPAELLETYFPGSGLSFPKHARNRRGVVAWVERPGQIALNERARLHVPHWPGYPPIAKRS